MNELIDSMQNQKKDIQLKSSDNKQMIVSITKKDSFKNDQPDSSVKSKTNNSNNSQIHKIQVLNPIINMEKQPQGIDELFLSYKKRFYNVLQLIDYKNSFNNILKSYEQLYDKNNQIQQHMNEENAVKNEQAQLEQKTDLTCSNQISCLFETSSSNTIEERIQELQNRKQKFQQLILGNIKDYYNIHSVLCREDNEITEKEQRILKSYFCVKSDAQSLKIIVVSLTNQILNENLQIYTCLKQSIDAEEFLQKQVQFRKTLQEMIQDKNSRNTSILLFLINFSRQAFLKQKEISETIFLNQQQTFKKFDQYISQLYLQSQTQISSQFITNMSQNQYKLIKSSTESFGIESQSRVSESQTTLGDEQSCSQNNLSEQFTLSPRNLINTIDSLKKRPSIFQKEFKKDQINNKLNEFSQFINNINTLSQSQSQNMITDIHQNKQLKEINFTNQQKVLKQFSSQTGLNQNVEQNSQQNRMQNIESDSIFQMINQNIRIANQKQQQTIYQNYSSHSSSLPRLSDPAILPQLREIVLKNSRSSQQIFNKANYCNKNSSNNNLDDNSNDDNDTSNDSDGDITQINLKNTAEISSIQKIPSHRNSLPSSLICNKEIRLDSSESTKSYLTDYNSEQVIVKRQSQLIVNKYPSPLKSVVKSQNTSCPQKDAVQETQKADLGFFNQNSQKDNAINSLNNYKNEYNQFFAQQVNKRSSIINNKDVKRQFFKVSNCYKCKWQNQDKSNFDDYTQLDEQYHQLACNSIVNTIESQQEKNNFIDKMYHNLMKMNTVISQSIKSYIQQRQSKLKMTSSPKTPLQPLKQNLIKNKFLNIPEEQNTRVNNYSYNKNYNKVSNNINTNNSNNSNNMTNSNHRIQFQKSPLPINIIQSKQLVFPSSQQVNTQKIDNNTFNFQNQNNNKNQVKTVNLTVVTAPSEKDSKNVEINTVCPQNSSNLKSLSLVYQNSAPVFTKNTSQQIYEDLLIKKCQNQSKISSQEIIQNPQKPINIKEQVIELIDNDVQQKQTKLNPLLFHHLCDGSYSDSYRNIHCSSSQSVSRHKTLKDKLNKFQQQEQFTFTKNRDQQKTEEITLDKLLNKQIQLSSRGFNTESSIMNNSMNDINLSQFQKFGNSPTYNILTKQQELLKVSSQQQVQFIFLQSQSPKLSQLKRERNQYQLTPNNKQVQNSIGVCSPHKFRNPTMNINSSSTLQQKQNQQDIKVVSDQFLNQSLQFQDQRKNLSSNSSYLTNRYVSLNQQQLKLNTQNSQSSNNLKFNFPYYKQSQTCEDDDIFKDLSITQPLKNSKIQLDSRKKYTNNIYTVK